MLLMHEPRFAIAGIKDQKLSLAKDAGDRMDDC